MRRSSRDIPCLETHRQLLHRHDVARLVVDRSVHLPKGALQVKHLWCKVVLWFILAKLIGYSLRQSNEELGLWFIRIKIFKVMLGNSQDLVRITSKNKMVIIYWTCGGVAKVAIIVTVRSQMDQTNHLAASRKFDFPEI